MTHHPAARASSTAGRITALAAVVCAGAAIMFPACVTENATAVEVIACDGGCGAGGRVRGSGGAAGKAYDAAAGGSAGGVETGGQGVVDAGEGGSELDAASSGGAAVEGYSLVVDAPADGETVESPVVVRGRAPGYLNVEVWDSTHQMPPLAQATPAKDGTFSMTVDTSALPNGTTTWTIWAWDSPPGQPFVHNEKVTLTLTLTGSDSGPPPTSGTETVGTGDITKPAVGPAPRETAKIGGAPFVLVKNWDFGTGGTIRDVASLVSEFQFHDQFGTIANGTKYGAVIVAPTAAAAIAAPNLGLPNDMQPVEEAARPYREWTATSLKAYVRPLSASQATCTVTAHDAGNGSLVAKWKLPNGGALLGRDVLWETRVRMPATAPAYWFALWTSGNQWNKGAEMDVLESFGTPNIYPPPTAFLVTAVGGTDSIDYSSWPRGLDAAGVPPNGRDLTQYHVWTWLYSKDDSYVAYFDGIAVQRGSIHWTLGGAPTAEALDMDFLFDFSWGHTEIADVNISLPASSFPITYEIDYSRVYLR